MKKCLKIPTLLALAATALALTNPASAQWKADYAADFAALDGNSDGVLTVDEYVEAMIARSISKNTAKGLSTTEIEEKAEANRKWGPRTFARIDANGDGKVVVEEYVAFREAGEKK